MPESFEPKDVVPANEFQMGQNENAIVGVQANESFMLKANEGHVLGKQGETVGFAKYQFSYDKKAMEPLQAEVDAKAMEIAEASSASKAVKDYNKVDNLIVSLPKDIERTQGEIDDIKARQLAGNGDPGALQAELEDRMEYMADLRKTEATLPELKKQRDDLAKDPEVDSFIKVKAEHKALSAKAEAPGNVAVTSANLYKEQSKMEGPERGGDRALLTRAVASHQVDQMLGTNVIAEEKFGLDKSGRPIGVSIQGDGAGITGSMKVQENGATVSKNAFLQADYSDPNVQKGLSDLEVVDYINGQIDRHCGNMFVDPSTGKVTGIDNDLAFPELDREEMLQRNPALGEKAVSGMPVVIHKETADKIMNLKPDDLRAALENMQTPDGVGKLSPESIDQAVKRLEDLQKAIKDPSQGPPGFEVVDKFDKNTYAKAMQRQNDAVQAHMGKPLNQVGADQDSKLQESPRTSYVGAAAVQKKRYENGMQEKPEEFTMRPPGTTQKAALDKTYSAYTKMNEGQKNEFKDAKKVIASSEQGMEQAAQKLNKLENPSGVGKLSAMMRRGHQEKQINEVKAEMHQHATNMMDCKNKIGELVNTVQPPVQANAQDQGPALNKTTDAKNKVREKVRGFREDKMKDALGPSLDKKEKESPDEIGQKKGTSPTRANFKRQAANSEAISNARLRNK